MDCIVRGVAKSRTQLSDFDFHFSIYTHTHKLGRMESRQSDGFTCFRGVAAAAAATSLQSCESEVAQSRPTLCDPMDCSPPGSSVHGIFQARVLEWGAIAFSVAEAH